MRASPISASVAFDADGVQHGHLTLPYSHDFSAWGKIMIPITVIRNGAGPTALLTGANHGDEYEGPVALQELALTLDASAIRGRVIIVPAFNFPAFKAGTRTSPIDQGNLNRLFPGRPDGSITEKIADYFQRYLLPMADVVLDFHSGGRTLDFLPFAAAHILENPAQQAACVAARNAFNAPFSMMQLEIDKTGLYDTAAEDMGKIFVSTELGGGGSATAKSIAIAKKGLRNLLINAEILNAPLALEPSVEIDMPDGDCFTFAAGEGLFEPMVDLGDPVEKGDITARIWPKDHTGRAPEHCYARRSGILVGRHFPGLIAMGDCATVIAEIIGDVDLPDPT